MDYVMTFPAMTNCQLQLIVPNNTCTLASFLEASAALA